MICDDRTTCVLLLLNGGVSPQGILDLVMDTLKKEQHEANERLKVLYREKDQLAAGYKERKKTVDGLKEQLQAKIGEYSKLSENGTTTH